MSFLTFDQLDKESLSFQKSFSLNEGLKKSASHRVKVFLSHRHKDKSLVKKVIGFLKQFGAETYIDWLDHEMPEKTSAETAIIIKEKIKESKRFILLATPKSLDSKWIPWELGVGDILKSLNSVAILPLLVSDTYWAEREYYQIY